MKKKTVFLLVLILGFVVQGGECYGSEVEENTSIFEEVQEYLDEQGENLTFDELVDALTSGENENPVASLGGKVKETVVGELECQKNSMKKILIFAVFGAFFTCLAESFQRKEVQSTAKLLIQMSVLVILLSSFAKIYQQAYELMRSLLDFMKVLIPTYGIALTASTGSATGTGFYQWMLVVISVVDYLMLKILLPGTSIYVVISMLNQFMKEQTLSKMAEFLETLISFSAKILMGIVIGMNLLEGLALPATDSVKGRGLYRLAGLVPGVGSSGKAATELLVNSGIYLKNAIGVCGVVVIIILAITPIIKMIVFSFAYRLTAAIVEPVADKQIVESLTGLYKGADLLLKLCGFVMIMFILVLVIMCVLTNHI